MNHAFFPMPSLGGEKSTWRLAYQNVFSHSFLSFVNGLIDEQKWTPANVGKQEEYNPSVRSCLHQRLPIVSDVLEEIVHQIQLANQEIWRFDLQRFDLRRDPPHFIRYEKGGHYDWHIDHSAPMTTRKLSFVVPLTDPSDYDGGILEIFPSLALEEHEKMKSLGNLILFPSYVPHRITPVSRGTRVALVGWIHGPSFC